MDQAPGRTLRHPRARRLLAAITLAIAAPVLVFCVGWILFVSTILEAAGFEVGR